MTDAVAIPDDNNNGTPAMTAPVPRVDDETTEWNTVEITFTWKAGEPPLDMGTVTVSYDPVSSDIDDIPRYASGPTNDVITIERLHHDAAVPVRDQQAKLRYRTGHHEYLGGIWLLHHRVQRSRCS